MLKTRWAKGALVFLAAFLLITCFMETGAFARVGGGSSFGSRGSRSFSPPSSAPSMQPSSSNPYSQQSNPAGGFLRSMAGGIMGGLLGSMLFRGLGLAGGAGMGDGFGMMDFVLIALILCGIYWFIKRRRAQAASSQYYSQTGTVDPGQPSSYVPSYGQQDVGNDLGRGIGHIRQMDPSFNEKNFQDMCMDYFFKIQGAWINRDMAGVKGILADEIFGIIQRDAEKLKAEKKINCLDNIAVRSVDLTEAWQEEGKDFVTVKFYANLLDYTTDETTGQIVSGSKTEPVKFEEYWTFVRPVGANSWQLSAIQQVA